MKAGREKERERKKRENRRYGRVKARLRHSRKGVLSCGIGTAVLAVLILLVLTAFLSRGKGTALIGSFGMIDGIIAAIGLSTGVRGFREREKNYITCRLGIGLNGFVLVCLIAVFIRGIL